MASNTDQEKIKKQTVSDHLANERTLLAWVRTGIGIMAFGFVVVKFLLFVRQISLILGNPAHVQQYGYSAPIGTLLVITGALSLLLALFRYRRIENQLNNNDFRQSGSLLYGLVVLLIIISACLITYLIKST